MSRGAQITRHTLQVVIMVQVGAAVVVVVAMAETPV